MEESLSDKAPQILTGADQYQVFEKSALELEVEKKYGDLLESLPQLDAQGGNPRKKALQRLVDQERQRRGSAGK